MGQIGRRSLGPLVGWLTQAGMPARTLWMLPGLGVVALECLVAIGYLLAVRLDESRSRWLRRVTWFAFLGAVGFHLSAEVVLGLEIGWFSYYMIAVACVFFLPSSILWGLGALVHRWTAWLGAVKQDVPGSPVRFRVGLTILAVGGVAGVLTAIGRALDLPGARIVTSLAAVALVAASVAMLIARRHQEALRSALAVGLVAALMWMAVGWSNVRAVYYIHVGKDLRRQGDLSGALGAFERARQYAPGDKTIETAFERAKLHAPVDKALEIYMRRLRSQVDRTED
jgi:hypothetical protein